MALPLRTVVLGFLLPLQHLQSEFQDNQNYKEKLSLKNSNPTPPKMTCGRWGAGGGDDLAGEENLEKTFFAIYILLMISIFFKKKKLN